MADARPTLELVVARHEEDLAWLRNVPDAFRTTVYNKGGELPGLPSLPNEGREAHTYLHHILSRYDDLADITLFCQGKPFDHVPSFHRELRDLAAGKQTVDGFRWLGFIIDFDDATGSRLFANWSKNEEGRPLYLKSFYEALWEETPPTRFVFYPGAQFAVTSACIRQQPKAFYEKALALSLSHPDGAHCFERCWDKVFGVNGIPEAFREREMPVYLRPVERLGLTWSEVPEEHRGW